MKQNSIHMALKLRFNLCDYRWINEVFLQNWTLCDYFNHFLK